MQGPPARGGFLEFRIQQYTANKAQTELNAKRGNAAFGGLVRCAMPPLPLRRRQNVVAAAGVRLATYGAGQHHIIEERILRLRRANLKAVWRTSSRAALELVFRHFGLPWRAEY